MTTVLDPFGPVAVVVCRCGDAESDHELTGARQCLAWGCKCGGFVEDDDA